MKTEKIVYYKVDLTNAEIEAARKVIHSMNSNNQFSLERAKAGDAIETVEGHERRFIAYLPDRRERMRLVVLDPKADKLYSHHEDGRHCELVQSLALRMRPKARRKVKRFITSHTYNLHKPDGIHKILRVDNNLYEHRSDAVERASLFTDGQVHEITVEVDD